MEVRNGGNVPGVAGQCACAEAAGVVNKIGDDDFDELEGQPGGRGRGRRGDLLEKTPRVHPPD